MKKVAALRALSEVRDTLHGPLAPAFMRHVLVTGVGPKFVAGAPTDALAIHFVVRQKRAATALTHTERIPVSVAGFLTDVTDGGDLDLDATRAPALAAPIGGGYGTALLTASGAWGTVACAARSRDNRPMLVTSAHVVGLDEIVYDGSTDPPRRLGRCSGRLPTASRHELYGRRGSALEGQHLVDVAVIILDEGVILTEPAPLPQTLATDGDTASIDQWLLTSTPLVAWGAASRVWRRGTVLFYWPRRTQDNLYGLCLIQQDPGSEPGDSGSLWLAYIDGKYQCVGLHWGLSTDQKNVMSFVTDGIAALSHLGVRRAARTK